MDTKEHKICNIALSICTCEQKIADNILFKMHINSCYTIDYLKSMLANEISNKYNLDMIFHYVIKNADKYKSSLPIFMNYKEIGIFYENDYKQLINRR